jgi:radical SAM superfamily enzyme YgiQ (UPF0313 family)
MTIHFVNPSDIAFGTAVITPRWLYVLAAATPAEYGTPSIVDETLEPFDPDRVEAGDVVGIGIHTANALRGYHLGGIARARGATVIFGGIHATLYPDEARERGSAHAVVKGDGDLVWPKVLADVRANTLAPTYDGGRVEGGSFVAARWDLLPDDRYMWGSVQTIRGCPKHCSFCSVWRTDGQKPRQRFVDDVVREIVALRRRGFRFILLSDDNFYPVTLADLAAAARRADRSQLENLKALRQERFELMEQLAQLPDDLVFYTQITMEAAEDPEFLNAMRRAKIRGALVGIESVTPEGLKAVYKDFNQAGDALVTRLQAFGHHGVHVLGSFIFGLPTDNAETFTATVDLAQRAGVSFAQFVMLQPFPGTIDFARWEKGEAASAQIGATPLSRYWLMPSSRRPRIYSPHPTMTPDEIRRRTQATWDAFYRLPLIWQRSKGCVRSIRARVAFVLISKLYRQMYANTGIATDSARVARSARRARILARMARRLFVGKPMPELEEPLPRLLPIARQTTVV